MNRRMCHTLQNRIKKNKKKPGIEPGSSSIAMPTFEKAKYEITLYIFQYVSLVYRYITSLVMVKIFKEIYVKISAYRRHFI